jgi:hypothetical protein
LNLNVIHKDKVCTCLGSLRIETASSIVSIDEIAKERTGNVTFDDILPMYMPMH